MLKSEIIGNLGADVAIKEANGSKFATFRVADTQKWNNADGKEQSSTTWVDVTLNNVESKVIPYLKAGVKVYVRGISHLRLYSSAKDRCMKAGLTIVASEIELCGGSSDEVPKELISPDTGAIFKVAKYYQSDLDTSKWKKEDTGLLVDKQARRYVVVKGGWVAPEREPEDNPVESQSQTA